MTISEKVAHLKGVIEGMDYDVTTKEGKIISLIVDVLTDMATEVDQVEGDVDTLFDYADELDEDLGAVEEELYGDFDDCCECDDECCDDECDCGCEECASEEDK